MLILSSMIQLMEASLVNGESQINLLTMARDITMIITTTMDTLYTVLPL